MKDKFARKILDRKTAFQQGGLVGQVETTQTDTFSPTPTHQQFLGDVKRGK